jgi:hypothetical protein
VREEDPLETAKTGPFNASARPLAVSITSALYGERLPLPKVLKSAILARGKRGMTMRLLEFELETGGHVIVEVEAPAGGMGPVGVGDGIVQKMQKKFEDVLDGIPSVAEAVLSRLAGLTTKPDEVSIELGFKIEANGNLVLAKTAVEGHCHLTLGWKRKESV